MEAHLSRSRGSRLRSAWSILGFCNMVNHVARLLSGLLLGLLIPHFNAAPVIQDERQTGEFNIDARFKNIVLIVADSTNSHLVNKLIMQGLELSALSSFSRVASKTETSAASEMPEASGTSAASEVPEASGTSEKPSVYETVNAKRGKEPYHVEIVRIEKEKEASSNANEREPEQEASSIELEVGLDPVVSIISGSEKTMRSLWGSKESHDPERKSKQWLAGEVPEKHFQQSDEFEVREGLFGKPGPSLKKQLSTKQEKEEEDVLSVQERNELGNKSQELVLLGGGIENCGPGRFRDGKGICQHDANFQ